MTNLQRYDNSAMRAFEAFDKLTTPESFAVWCDSPVEQKLPDWVTREALFIDPEYPLDRYKVVRVVEPSRFLSYSGIWYTTEHAEKLIPVTTPDWLIPNALCHADNKNLKIAYINYPARQIEFFGYNLSMTFEDAIGAGKLKPGHRTPPLPAWLVPGQWVQHTTQSLCFRINHVSENYAYFEERGICPLKHFHDPDPNYIPVTIRPWSFDEARVAMNSNVLLWIRRQYSDISGVIAHKDGTTSICLSNGTSYRTSAIPECVTTSNHQPCGTPVPM